MKTYEIFHRNPLETSLANSGQSRIDSAKELRAELETFVSDGLFGDALDRILGSYLQCLKRPRQDSAWISGFFGSGKSHLLKVFGHLCADTEFEDGSTARTLVHDLPSDVLAHLQELDTEVARSQRQILCAAGTLPAGSGDHVRRTVLSIIFKACDLPTQYAQAGFVFWLQEKGYYAQVKEQVEGKGKEWMSELNNLYVSPIIAEAIMSVDADFASDVQEARQTLRAQFPQPPSDVTTDEFIGAAKSALAVNGEVPLMILALDEVQQYIGDSSDRAVTITELVEVLQTQFDSKILLVASGQSALSKTPLLFKMNDRFRIKVQLSDSDVEAVTRKVLLRKKASAKEPLKQLLSTHAGEISRQLSGTGIKPRSEDESSIQEDFPLLPCRRRFWEHCFRAVDAAGTHSQLRSQLRIIADALSQISEKELGYVIPGDELYKAIASDMVNSGVLLNEISTRIQELNDGSEDGLLRHRISSLVFLIGKLSREEGVDQGIRSTPAIIADLLIDNITVDNGPFRDKVRTLLEEMKEKGSLMEVDSEYLMQTTQGAEWEREFREQCVKLQQDEMAVGRLRDQLFNSKVQEAVATIRLKHGDSNTPRKITFYDRAEEPPSGQLIAWFQHGWSASQKEVESLARNRGQDDPALLVFVPKKGADDVKRLIIEAEAARVVVTQRAMPSKPEGLEARQAMESRRVSAEKRRDQLVQDILRATKVYQGGGNELHQEDLAGKLQFGAEASLVRLYPHFADADHKSWPLVLSRVKQGSDDPFKSVGWDQPTETHPVAKEVLSVIGGGKRGSEVQKHLQAPPFGWPLDAIDAVFLALHRMDYLIAKKSGQVIAAGTLDQSGVKSAEFTRESSPPTAQEKLKVRGLYQGAGVAVKPGEELLKASEYLQTMRQLANSVGGEPPLPQNPGLELIDEISSESGNAQLRALCEKSEELKDLHDGWGSLLEIKEKRMPKWETLLKFQEHAAGLEVADPVQAEIQSITGTRSLLEGADSISPLIADLAQALREAITSTHNKQLESLSRVSDSLSSDAKWRELDDASKERLFAEHKLNTPNSPSMATDNELLSELNTQNIAARHSDLDAIPQRATNALNDAVKILTPSAKPMTLNRCSLDTEADVNDWIDETKSKLLKAIAEGPIILN